MFLGLTKGLVLPPYGECAKKPIENAVVDVCDEMFESCHLTSLESS
ncbi:MAG: hypothetical protein HRT83_05105 [Hyphomicrobiaceae bacterium]|nr:hypothetical protein [Hyphomicrobiaceae bacterium]